MFSAKNLTLLGSNGLFFGVLVLLFLYPTQAVILYPLLSAVFFWTDFRRDDELSGLFLIMSVVVGLIVLSRAPDAARTGLGVEIVGLLLTSVGMGLHRRSMVQERQRTARRTGELEVQIRDLERDQKFYSAFGENAAAQVELRRDLTEAAKSLGATLDPQEVQLRLVHAVQKRHPDARIRIVPGQPEEDPLVHWAAQGHGSIMVKDAHNDERFRGAVRPGFRSAMVSPLAVLKRPFGYLCVESDRPSAFKPDDLKTTDFFSTLASLSLENVQLIHNVNDLAVHDPLTQLYTHRAFQNRLEEEILRAARSQQPFSIVMSDVDHFKRYNDTYGHQAGDLLLKTVAGILAHSARPVDFVARYGGEEFVLILPGLSHAPSVEFAERLRSRIAEEPFLFRGNRTGVTMSFGVASFPEDTTTGSQIMRTADERLYRAKHGGRDRVVGK